jgi:hypothetical protein
LFKAKELVGVDVEILGEKTSFKEKKKKNILLI